MTDRGQAVPCRAYQPGGASHAHLGQHRCSKEEETTRLRSRQAERLRRNKSCGQSGDATMTARWRVSRSAYGLSMRGRRSSAHLLWRGHPSHARAQASRKRRRGVAPLALADSLTGTVARMHVKDKARRGGLVLFSSRSEIFRRAQEARDRRACRDRKAMKTTLGRYVLHQVAAEPGRP